VSNSEPTLTQEQETDGQPYMVQPIPALMLLFDIWLKEAPEWMSWTSMDKLP
jgi:hypothetical protein